MTQKDIRPENPILLLIIATSSGEVDWILPVLRAYLTKNKNWRLVTVFGHKVVFDRFRLSNQILFKEFMEVSAMNLVPQELGTFFTGTVQPEQVKIVFKDYNKDEFSPLKLQIAQQCPNAMMVSFPHSCHIYSRADKDPVRICEHPDAFSKHDIFLLDSENDIPHWSQSVAVTKIKTLGYPRYDSWWIDRFINDAILTSSTEYQRSQQADKVFFYVSRCAHPHYLSQADYEYLLKSIAETAFSYDDSLLLIKPHPRQDIKELFQLLEPYDKNRYLVSGLHLMQLSHISDVVISGWSSGILDALSVRKPVIEFWRFGGRDPLCRKEDSGNYTTIYRELGLAAPADTKEELKNLVCSALTDPKAPVWQSQIDAFNTHCKFSDTAAHDIADLLITELTKRFESAPAVRQPEASDIAAHDRPHDLIDGMIEYVALLVEKDQQKAADQWLSFMNAQFPNDKRILNNYSILLFNQGKINEAVDHLVNCLNRFPTSSETVINLIQILLMVDREKEAMDIVISFFSRVAEPDKKKFLQALAEQLTENQFAVVYTGIRQLQQQR